MNERIEKNKNGNILKKKRKFLFVSWESLSGDLAWQIKKEGHEVKVYIKSEDARKQTYSRLENILLQNMFCRTDIGLGWYEDSDKLQTWGYLY